MFKVKISSGHAAQFETMELAQVWIDSQETKPLPWGNKPHRFVTDISDEDISKAIESVSVEDEFTGERIITYEFAPEYTIEIIDITEEHAANERRNERKALGKKVAVLCADVYDYITGLNVGRALTAEQVSQMEQDFAGVITYIERKRPWSAWPLVCAIVPDEVLLDDEMLGDIKSIFIESGLGFNDPV